MLFDIAVRASRSPRDRDVRRGNRGHFHAEAVDVREGHVVVRNDLRGGKDIVVDIKGDLRNKRFA
jgi:hypothetical protein